MRRPLLTEVVETSPLTPHMIRVVVEGDDLAGFGAGAFTDHYVKLQLPPPGAPFGPPFDPEDIKARYPRHLWPRTRTYTVRAWDPHARRVTIDFVHHGDIGIAGPWAVAASPGDRLQLLGPGGAYAPSPDVARHLMVGDESVIPAISASLERVPAGVPVDVLLEVEGPADELPLTTPGDLRLTWLHRNAAPSARPQLLTAVERLAFPAGDIQAFVHGEAADVRAVRRHLVVDRGIPTDALSVSGYWKRTRDEEGWRQDKPGWSRLVEADARRGS